MTDDIVKQIIAQASELAASQGVELKPIVEDYVASQRQHMNEVLKRHGVEGNMDLEDSHQKELRQQWRIELNYAQQQAASTLAVSKIHAKYAKMGMIFPDY